MGPTGWLSADAHRLPADAAAAKEELNVLIDDSGWLETNKVHSMVCRWWNQIEVFIVTGATTGRSWPRRYKFGGEQHRIT